MENSNSYYRKYKKYKKKYLNAYRESHNQGSKTYDQFGSATEASTGAPAEASKEVLSKEELIEKLKRNMGKKLVLTQNTDNDVTGLTWLGHQRYTEDLDWEKLLIDLIHLSKSTLTKLKLSGYDIKDAFIIKLDKSGFLLNNQVLEELDLNNCPMLSEKTITVLFKKSEASESTTDAVPFMLSEHNLRILDLSMCHGLSDSIYNLSQIMGIKLDELRLRDCSLALWQVIGFISNWTHLKRIDLSVNKFKTHEGYFDYFLSALQYRKTPLELKLYGNEDLLCDEDFPSNRTFTVIKKDTVEKDTNTILTIKAWNDGQAYTNQPTADYEIKSMEEGSGGSEIDVLNTLGRDYESKPVKALLQDLYNIYGQDNIVYKMSSFEPMSNEESYEMGGYFTKAIAVDELVAILKENHNIKLIPSPERPGTYLTSLTSEQNRQIGEAMKIT